MLALRQFITGLDQQEQRLLRHFPLLEHYRSSIEVRGRRHGCWPVWAEDYGTRQGHTRVCVTYIPAVLQPTASSRQPSGQLSMHDRRYPLLTLQSEDTARQATAVSETGQSISEASQ